MTIADTLALKNRIEMFGPEVGEYVFRLECKLSEAEAQIARLIAERDQLLFAISPDSSEPNSAHPLTADRFARRERPVTCNVGDTYGIYVCLAPNTWTVR